MVVLACVPMVWTWLTYGPMDHTSGTWTAMALDLRYGTFYRPIVSGLGYGGTRYMPGHAVAQAALMRMGFAPVASGYALDVIGILLVGSGLYALMRKLNIPAATALPMSCLILAASCYRLTAAAIKGDLLPAGLNLWGLALIVSAVGQPNLRRTAILIAAAAAIFVLAVATKITSIFGAGAAFIWLLSRRQVREAMWLAAVWIITLLAAALLTQWASGGRALAIFRLCASGGGGVHELLLGPQHFFREMGRMDHPLVVMWAVALALLIVYGRWLSLVGIYFVLTTLVTIAIFGSPGTNYNHLLDACAASMLVIAFYFHSREASERPAGQLAMGMFIVAAVLGLSNCARHLDEFQQMGSRQQLTQVLELAARGGSGPILSENPVVPIAAGERPYMIDSFMLRAVRAKRPEITRQLWKELAQHRFRAVVLDAAPNYKWYYDATGGDFGLGFTEELQKWYALSGVTGNFWVFLPKK
jgi:hypothetical protein